MSHDLRTQIEIKSIGVPIPITFIIIFLIVFLTIFWYYFVHLISLSTSKSRKLDLEFRGYVTKLMFLFQFKIEL